MVPGFRVDLGYFSKFFGTTPGVWLHRVYMALRDGTEAPAVSVEAAPPHFATLSVAKEYFKFNAAHFVVLEVRRSSLRESIYLSCLRL